MQLNNYGDEEAVETSYEQSTTLDTNFLKVIKQIKQNTELQSNAEHHSYHWSMWLVYGPLFIYLFIINIVREVQKLSE